MIDTLAMVRELCDAHTNRERIEREYTNDDQTVTLYAEDWTVQCPPLLDQLQAAVHHVRNGDDAGGSGPTSRPSAQVDAIDTLNRISGQAYDWAPRATLIDTVRAAHSVIANSPPCQKWDPRHGCCNRHIGEWQIRRWHTWARLATGWDRPPFRPDATCPACGKRGGLRVRLDLKMADCAEADCAETWDERTFGQLAKHIEAEAECAEAGCDHRAAHTVRVCDTTYRNLTRSSLREIVTPVGDVSPQEASILAGLTG